MKSAEGGRSRACMAAGSDGVAAGRRRREMAGAGEDLRGTGALRGVGRRLGGPGRVWCVNGLHFVLASRPGPEHQTNRKKHSPIESPKQASSPTH
jgi:hypothetical protein